MKKYAFWTGFCLKQISRRTHTNLVRWPRCTRRSPRLRPPPRCPRGPRPSSSSTPWSRRRLSACTASHRNRVLPWPMPRRGRCTSPTPQAPLQLRPWRRRPSPSCPQQRAEAARRATRGCVRWSIRSRADPHASQVSRSNNSDRKKCYVSPAVRPSERVHRVRSVLGHGSLPRTDARARTTRGAPARSSAAAAPCANTHARAESGHHLCQEADIPGLFQQRARRRARVIT